MNISTISREIMYVIVFFPSWSCTAARGITQGTSAGVGRSGPRDGGRPTVPITRPNHMRRLKLWVIHSGSTTLARPCKSAESSCPWFSLVRFKSPPTASLNLLGWQAGNTSNFSGAVLWDQSLTRSVGAFISVVPRVSYCNPSRYRINGPHGNASQGRS